MKQKGIKYHIWFFDMNPPGIEPWSPGPVANALTIIPTGVSVCVCVCVCVQFYASLLKSLIINIIARVSQKFNNIFVCARVQCEYHVTETVQAVVTTRCSWWVPLSYCADKWLLCLLLRLIWNLTDERAT